MNKDKKCHSLVIFSFITIFTIFTISFVIPSQKIFASGITIYSPYWMNYEKDLKSPYFESCGIFDSCLSNDIRIFPFLPLTTHAEKDDNTYFSPKTTISTPPIPFELPFP